jgi:hypothetical protein
MTTVGALGSLGSDLAFSVSFGIANELLDAAKEAHLSEDELIGIVLAVTVLLAALPSSVASVRRQFDSAMRGNVTAGSNAGNGGREPSGVAEFVTLLLTMAQRIALSVCVQLIASNVRSRQPLRSVRVVSLLAVSIFFLFLESTSSVGNFRK